jgi:glucose-6-phosphate isomerase, archaeal
MSKDPLKVPLQTTVDWNSGAIAGEGVEEQVKKMGQLAGLFYDEAAWQGIDPELEVYRVRYWRPVPEGTTGGLFWGSTTIQPGLVGDEYFMTHGHFHSIRDRAEFYATVKGRGVLLFMDDDGNVWTQAMALGSVHYVPGKVAHRVINTGDQPLVFLATWPSDAGHDYGSIRTRGFSKRMVMRNGEPCLI